MFRILCDPLSGSTGLCLTEITRGDSQIFLSCAWSVFGSVILNLWCVFTVGPAGNYSCRQTLCYGSHQSHDLKFVIVFYGAFIQVITDRYLYYIA